MRKVLLIGAGGHAKVVLEFLKKTTDIEIVGLIEKDQSKIGGRLLDLPVIGADEQLVPLLNAGATHALITVGSVGDNSIRKKLYDQVQSAGFSFINAVHPLAVVSGYARLGTGNTLMAGAMIGPDTVIGNNVIVNTGAVIEHDCVIGDHVHIAPGSKIAGGVRIGSGSFIGIGAVIIQGLTVGENVLIGAGTVVVDNIPDNAVVFGAPGKIRKYRENK